jgi:glucosyl-3-phosphoglycerate synthase
MPEQLPDSRAQAWFESHTYSGEVDVGELVSAKSASRSRISVCLPARNEASTIGVICRVIRDRLMQADGLVDELIVIDSGSSDGTAEIASAAGAAVLRPEEAPGDAASVPGKGAALWRSVAAATGDIVVWLDSDTRNFSEHFVTRLVAPLLLRPDLKLVKAFYDRPLATGDSLANDGGGRVTELAVRPLLNLLYPALSGVIQPLAGECALRREALMQLPFVAGYGVEVALLIDVVERWGLDALGQADLGVRVHRNRDLLELGQMSFEILHTLMLRFEDLGLLKSADPLERSLVQFQGRRLKVSQAAAREQLPPMKGVLARGATVTLADRSRR